MIYPRSRNERPRKAFGATFDTKTRNKTPPPRRQAELRLEGATVTVFGSLQEDSMILDNKATRRQRRQRHELALFFALFCWIANCKCVSGSNTPPWRPFKLSLPAKKPLVAGKKSPRSIKRNKKQSLVAAARLPLVASLQMIAGAETIAAAAAQSECGPIHALLVANTVVWILWFIATQDRDEELLAFLSRHFISRPGDLTQGQRLHTMLLSAFSHKSLAHLISNMLTLLVFGPKISANLGNRRFSYFYLGAIYASDLFDLLIYSQFRPKYARILVWKIPIGSLGASGAISALLTYACWQHPHDRYDISGMLGLAEPLHVPAWALMILHIASDLFPTTTEGSNIGHGAHLGGYIFGAGVYLGCRLWKYIVQTRRKNKKDRLAKWVQQLFSRKKSKSKGLQGMFKQMGTWKKQAGDTWENWLEQTAKSIARAHETIEEELHYQINRIKGMERRQAGSKENVTNDTRVDVGAGESKSDDSESETDDLPTKDEDDNEGEEEEYDMDDSESLTDSLPDPFESSKKPTDRPANTSEPSNG